MFVVCSQIIAKTDTKYVKRSLDAKIDSQRDI